LQLLDILTVRIQLKNVTEIACLRENGAVLALFHRWIIPLNVGALIVGTDSLKVVKVVVDANLHLSMRRHATLATGNVKDLYHHLPPQLRLAVIMGDDPAVENAISVEDVLRHPPAMVLLEGNFENALRLRDSQVQLRRTTHGEKALGQILRSAVHRPRLCYHRSVPSLN
jgi:hypothetical protein